MACLRYNISKLCHIKLKNQFNLKIDSIYDLYHSLIHLLEKKLFALETCIDRYYLVLNFYQINGGDEIQILDHLITKILISY
jgi:hypothetical protein